MKTYSAEHGLDLKNSIAYTVNLVEDNSWVKDESAIARHITDVNFEPSPGLFYIRSILASSVMNKNDDVFLPSELWAGRKSIVGKPLNWEHNENEIVGSTLSQWAITPDGNIMSDTIAEEELPNLFHVVTGSAIYTQYRDEDLQARAELIIEEVKAGKLGVSMECQFDNMSYLLSKGSEIKLVERNEETAFLTRHLRMFGGEGEYKGYRIGRVLRNISFSAHGLVNNPANKDSKILESGEISDFSFAKKNSSSPFGVHSVCKANSNLEKDKMADTDHGAELKEAQAQIRELQEALVKADAAKFETRIEDLTASVQDRDEKLEVSAKALEEKEKALACKCEEYDKLEKEKSELQAKYDELQGELKSKARVQVFLDKNYPLAEAQEEAKKFSGFSDENFQLLAAVLPARKELVSEESTDAAETGDVQVVADATASLSTAETPSQSQTKLDERKTALAAITDAYAEHLGVKEKK